MQALTLKNARFALAVVAVLMFLPLAATAQHYLQTNLVSDIPGLAAHTDTDLANSWGVARSGTSPWWVADNGTGKATIYTASGVKQGLVVTIPPATGTGPGTPTGIVFNGGSGFAVTKGTASGAALFIFATEDGTISGWSPSVDATHAIIKVGPPTVAIYKGLAIGTFNSATYLYAANFETGKVDVYDSTWASFTPPGGFVDADIPTGYAPFAVHNIGGKLFVTYAKQGEGVDEVDGKGLGFVDEFDTGGTLLLRLQHGPWFNAPWGVAVAPANFGAFSNDVLVGNFGSGQIVAFDATTGDFLGYIHGKKGPISIEGLWAISFGGGVANNGATNALFFTAGIEDEDHGLFGTLTPILKGNGDDDEDDND
jgi:uncharacterized protein (TIGR03118 family)